MPNSVTMSLRCSYCGERDIDRICGDCCVLGENGHYTVTKGYCSIRCQAADWPNHREACKALNLLKRTAMIMFTLFLVAEDQASCLNPTSCYDAEDVFMIREQSQLLEAMQVKYFVHPYPRHKFATRRRDWMLGTSDQIARDLMDQIYPLKVWLWNDLLCESVEEVSILVKNTYHPIVRSKSNGRRQSTALRPHKLFRVTLKTGDKYAVDITGGRFGWDEWVVR
ncbi:hypothetical protein M434DRAFT_14149 [Hypoxylon sp. CO27-5]|nr:hypothetical protein M434DRAFT_14149 [Hypoxylon sp. CO27-5]